MNTAFGKTLLLLFVLNSFRAYSQAPNLYGTIADADTRAPLAFVSVTIKGSTTGTLTDIDGHFKLRGTAARTTLVISYVGYKTIEFNTRSSADTLAIYLQRVREELETVVISQTENPAHRVIRLVQQNRKKNDPEQLSSFRYHAYTIAVLSAGNRFWNMNRSDSGRSKKQDPTGDQLNKLAERARDTAGDKRGAELGRRFKENHLLVTESYTERIFRFPNQTREKVLATKFSGLKNPAFGVTTSNFQPFGFYKDYLVMNNKSYVSPLIGGSISMYKFRLKETIIHETDTTFVISFEPRKGKNFNGLKGLLYINSDKYAIENIQAAPASESGLIFTFRLQQKYERVEGNWFPAQLNTTLSQKDLKTDSVILFWDARSYITQVEIGKDIKRSDFSDVQLEYDPRAGKQTDTAWARMRTDTLNEKSRLTYETFEMLPPRFKNTIEKVNKGFQVLAIEAIPWGKVDVPFRYILSGINKYETFRIGAGIQTNSRLSKWFSAGGYAGYGIRDKAWKYGGNLQLYFKRRTGTTLRFDYSQDIVEPGTIDYFLRTGSVFSNQSLRNFQRSRMDSAEQYRVGFSTHLLPTLQWDTWLLHEKRSPAGYDYLFSNGPGQDIHGFQNTEIGIGLRFAKGEIFTRMGHSKLRTKPASTQLLLQVAKGLSGTLNGQLDYTRAIARLNHKFSFKKLGETTVQLEAGVLWGDAPYSYLFNLPATNTGKRLTLYVPGNFQTAGLYEFASGRTASLFVEHNFGNLLFKPRNIKFRPELLLVQGISYGSLDKSSTHKLIHFTVPEKGLFESGLVVRNLYRRSILSVAYLGIGGGVFYRYGYYALPHAGDNWVFKWGFSISF